MDKRISAYLTMVEDFCRLSTGPFKEKYPDYGFAEGSPYLARKARELRTELKK